MKQEDVLEKLTKPMTAAQVCAMFPGNTLRAGLYLTQLVNDGKVKMNKQQSLMQNIPKPLYRKA